jgi:adenosylcobinamide kinase / adenosylcobinamide-phosphate guanylyltransferase
VHNLKTITLLLGGARSGKSFFAQEAAKKAKKVLFVATAEAGDEDMKRRIRIHKEERPAHWKTLEATSHIGGAIEKNRQDEELVIIDCITLLVTNIICQIDEKEYDSCDEGGLEEKVYAEIKELQACLKKCSASFILVSNEVGLGIVPDNRISRIYRDLLGRANQMLAQSADEVYLMVAGIPLKIKPR